MSKNRQWGALSMSDRAFLIREAVRNGITDINEIKDTWEHRFDGKSEVGYKTHNDPLLSDAESFNGRFTDLRPDEVLQKEYKSNPDRYDPSNLVGRIGLSPSQVVRDQIHLADLRTVELNARNPYSKPSFKGNVKNSDDVANYLSSTIPKTTLQEDRARYNLGISQKQFFDMMKSSYNSTAAGITTTRKKDDTSGMIVYNEHNFSPNEGLDRNNTKVHERHHFRSHENASPWYDTNRANPYSRKGWLVEFDADRILRNPESSPRISVNHDTEKVEQSKYYTPTIKYKYSPEEIDARIKSVQFSNKLDPTHVYTQQDLEEMRKDPNFQWHNTDNLRDDVFLDRLNHTFSGEENTQHKTYISKKN